MDAAAPASIIAFISSKTFSGPPKPASPSATIGANQLRSLLALGVVDPVGALSAWLMRFTTVGNAVGRVQALVRIHVARKVRISGHLPPAQVDCLEAGLDLLDGLVAG